MSKVMAQLSSGRFMSLVLAGVVFVCALSVPEKTFGRTVTSNLLPSGHPLETSLPGNSFGSIGIEVPEGAQQLTVTLTKGSGNLDIYLKFGSAASGGTATQSGDILANFLSDVDISSTGTSADQIIVLNANTNPPLQSGIWYLSAYNKNAQETSFTITASLDSAGIPVPQGQFIFPPYNAVTTPLKSVDPSTMHPMGLGQVATGGDALTFGLSTQAFNDPVNIYLGLLAPPIAPGIIYLFRPDNSLSPLSSGFLPWRANTTSAIDVSVLDGILASSLPEGIYYLYTMVTPTDRTDNYYLWTTQFGGATKATVTPDTETMLSSIDGDLSLTFPAGSVTEDTEISISPLAGGIGFEFGPDGQQFQTPVALTFNTPMPPPSESDDTVSIPLMLGVVVNSDGTVDPIDQMSVSYRGGDTNAVVSGELSHFSDFIFENLANKHIFSIDLNVGSSVLGVGESTNVTITANSRLPFERTFTDSDGNKIWTEVTNMVTVNNISIETSGVLTGNAENNQHFNFTGTNSQILLETAVTCRREGDGSVIAPIMYSKSGIDFSHDGSGNIYPYSTPIDIKLEKQISCRELGRCGDGLTNQASEQCDTNDLNGASCVSLGFDGGWLECDYWDCLFDTRNCWNEQIVPDCGDGVINQPSEECDGNDFGEQSCTSLGYDSGVLSCNSNCSISTAGCSHDATDEEVGMVGSLDGSFAHFDGYSQVQVSGTIINDIGNPLAGAQVTLNMTPGGTQTVTTNQSGQFQTAFTIYQYGTYTVEVTDVTGTGIIYDSSGSGVTSVQVVVN